MVGLADEWNAATDGLGDVVGMPISASLPANDSGGSQATADADPSERNLILLAESLSIIDEANLNGLNARLLGGLAVLHHDEQLKARGGSRRINDIDLIVPSGEERAVARLLVARGYRPEPRFNALNGHRRMLFHAAEWDLDILVGVFEMCHRLELIERIPLDYPTLPVTDLLLTKLQIVRLNQKDAQDISDIIATHELERGPGDWIDVQHMNGLVSRDWGLWRTITETIRTVVAGVHDGAVVAERLRLLETELNATPKSRRWKLRARVGDRIPWYDLPDEVRQ